MTDPEDLRLHATGSTAIDSIAENVDRLATTLDGVDMVAAVTILGNCLVDFEPAGREVYARALAVTALRHHRTLEAAAGLASEPQRATPWGPFLGAAAGALMGVLLAWVLL